MGIQIAGSELATDFHGTARSWPKCARCSARLGRPYPVETIELEGAESPKLLGSRYRFVVVVECHGESMRCAMEIPAWWGRGMPMQALAYLYAFVAGAHGVYKCEVRRGTRGQSAGALTTEVR